MIAMEARKVQRTGKSTLIVSLPKNWVMRNNILCGSILFISKNQNGTLSLSAKNSEQDLMTRLDVGGKSGEPLIRDVIACYLAGYRTIEITSLQMSADQKRDLHQIVNKLIGTEILEETVNTVVVQDLLSSDELQTDLALKRIKNMTKLMVQDALSALLKRNTDLAQDVMQRDNDVDRLNLLVARQFMEILRSGSVKQEALSAIAAFNYMQAASNLERMADHSTKIANATLQNNCAIPARIEEELSKLASELGAITDDCISLLLHADSDGANRLIDSIVEMKKRMQIVTNSLPGEDPEEMRFKHVVAGSIERILDHIMNINELTINLCNANLE
jgi:phosphate uptake regulator